MNDHPGRRTRASLLAEVERLTETQRKFGTLMHEVMSERDNLARELGECSSANETMEREIDSLKAELDSMQRTLT